MHQITQNSEWRGGKKGFAKHSNPFSERPAWRVCMRRRRALFNTLDSCTGEEVASVAGNSEVLGWFVQQTGPPRQPSIRERTVTAAMAACVPAGMPVIFAQMFTTFEADRSTFSFQQRYLQQVGLSSAVETRKIDWCMCVHRGCLNFYE